MNDVHVKVMVFDMSTGSPEALEPSALQVCV